MKLSKISYTEYEGQDQEWSVRDLELGQVNLLVGKNATGKSRVLSAISNLAVLLSGRQLPNGVSSYEADFREADSLSRYTFRSIGRVVSENLVVDGRVRLNRGADGQGTIYAKEIGGGTDVRFQSPPEHLAAVARRDAIQHPYLQPLYDWGHAVRLYRFGTSLGQQKITVVVAEPPEVDDRDANQVVEIYRKANKLYGAAFAAAVARDMSEIGYALQGIETGPLVSHKLAGEMPGPVHVLRVRETGLRGVTDALAMSQGMFRALSLLIQLNYLELSGRAACILIDDIGEGLDFDRSCRLIRLIREKVLKTRVQLVMSTNDRFVMNELPLEEWRYLRRDNERVTVLSVANSRELFEEFKFTGLSNFSFLEMGFVDAPPEEVPVG